MVIKLIALLNVAFFPTDTFFTDKFTLGYVMRNCLKWKNETLGCSSQNSTVFNSVAV